MNLMWFRRDLRIEDNPALYEACLSQSGVVAIYIETPLTWASHHMGHNQQQWLKVNLDCLEQSLAALNIPLIRLTTDFFSDCPALILNLIEKYQIDSLYFNLEYEWDERRRDQRVIQQLSIQNVSSHTFHDQCLMPPDAMFNQQGKPYTVFTPYKKSCLSKFAIHPEGLLCAPTPAKQPHSIVLKSKTELMADYANSFLKAGDKAAKQALTSFIESSIESYKVQRDLPILDTTSKLSSYLALGVISARQCIAGILQYYQKSELSEVLANEGIATWVSELVWRDFYKMICFQYPYVSRNQPFQKHTNALIWHDNAEHLKAWQTGQTGVPIVDAAMRQLNQTGWMHNRLRMVVAMYLSKNLWLDWRLGEAYFASKLIDWDFSANNGGWQWSASTGTDAAPYFRIFNPISQSERFDPEGKFIKKYCPELKNLDKKTIHDPFNRGAFIKNYPKSLVDLKATRAYAIEAFKKLSQEAKS